MERVFSAGIFGLLSIALLDGFSARQASWVMLALQFGAAIGTLLLSWVMDRLPAWAVSALIYVGTLVSLTALGLASQRWSMLVAGFVATGGQYVLFALAPHFYRPSIRTTGFGMQVHIPDLHHQTSCRGHWRTESCVQLLRKRRGFHREPVVL